MGISQENPLYIHTVCRGGFYTEEFKQRLLQVENSKWLTTESFNAIYEVAFANYAEETKPEKVYGNAKKYKFSMNNSVSAALNSTDGNVAFSVYIKEKLSTFNEYFAE